MFPVFAVIVIALLLAPFLILQKGANLEATEKAEKFLLEDSRVTFSLPATNRSATEESERMMINACLKASAYVSRCEACFSTGNSYCPYPTQSFCLSVKSANTSGYDIYWSFLPNDKGKLVDVKTASVKDPKLMRDVSELGEGIRYMLNNTYDYSIAEKNDLEYSKPIKPNNVDIIASPCAVEGIISSAKIKDTIE